MFNGLSLPVLVLIFVGAAVAVWFAGVRLSDTTDMLATRFGFGQALGGLILLAFATNLPEVAITVSAAVSGSLGIAIGNILGGIAIQTLVLVALDAFGTRGGTPLSHRAASLALVLEAALVIAVLIVAIMASRLPPGLVVARVAPGDLLIVLLWGGGLWLINTAQGGLPWHDAHGDAPDTQDAPRGAAKQQKHDAATQRGESTGRIVLVFVAAAVVTLIGGVLLEESGNALAGQIGLSGVLFGATFLAAATSLPELSTGLAAAKLEDYQLAFSDIFGGNAFLPVLFFVATLISGKAVLPQAQDTDIYLAGLGILLTTVYIAGLIFRPQKRVLGMGRDSFAVLVLYCVGMVGLIAVARQ